MKIRTCVTTTLIMLCIPTIGHSAMFQLAGSYETWNSPSCVVAADFDGDSDIDVAVGHDSAHGIYTYLNDGSGNFTICDTITSPLLHALYSADINGDGIVDLITPDEVDHIGMYLGQGDGTFTAGDLILSPSPMTLAIADYDGDGVIDIAFGSGSSSFGVYMLWGEGGGAFATHVPMDTGPAPSVVAADFDDDGHLDLFSNRGWLWNNGDRTFTKTPWPVTRRGFESMPSAAPAAPSHFSDAPQAADLNNDGFPDVVITFGGADCRVIFDVMLNNGDRTFADPVQIFKVGAELAAVRTAAIADFDLDGWQDILVTQDDGSDLQLYLNDESTSWPRQAVGLNFGGSNCVAAADFDGDDDLDIAIANDYDDYLIIGRNIGARHYVTWYVPDDFATVQDAIEAAISGDTIIVQAHASDEARTGPFDFGGKDLVLITEGEAARAQGAFVPPFAYGSAWAEEVILYGGDSGTVFNLVNGETQASVVAGFTIQGGNGSLGGGFNIRYSSPTIRNNIIRSNQATHGGGIFAYDSDAAIHHNVIYGNTAATWGGGVYLQVYGGVFSNNTVTQNSAGSATDGLLCRDGAPVVRNSIVWGNGTPGDEVLTDGGTPTIEYCLIEGGWPGTGNIDADPMFVDPGTGDFHIQAGSPCIDAGDPSDPLDPDDTPADIGCFCYLAPTGVGGSSELPTEFELYPNYPNPFNAATRIAYVLPRHARVQIEIFDVLGRRVITLLDREQHAGAYAIDWGGTDADGEELASGMYFYRISVGEQARVRKMVLLK